MERIFARNQHHGQVSFRGKDYRHRGAGLQAGTSS